MLLTREEVRAASGASGKAAGGLGSSSPASRLTGARWLPMVRAPIRVCASAAASNPRRRSVHVQQIAGAALLGDISVREGRLAASPSGRLVQGWELVLLHE